MIWHHIIHPSIRPLDTCLRRGYRCYNTALTRKFLPQFTPESMLWRWYIFHHTTHTSPYRRQIGKHIWRKRFDAQAGQAQTPRFCRARAVSREQTRRVDTENAIAKKNVSLKSTQVPRPVFAQSQQGIPWGTSKVKVSLTRHNFVSAWIVQAPSGDKKGPGCRRDTDTWGNIALTKVSAGKQEVWYTWWFTLWHPVFF